MMVEEITVQEFERLYYAHSNKELAEKLKVSPRTLCLWIKKYGIKKKNGWNTRPARAVSIVYKKS